MRISQLLIWCLSLHTLLIVTPFIAVSEATPCYIPEEFQRLINKKRLAYEAEVAIEEAGTDGEQFRVEEDNGVARASISRDVNNETVGDVFYSYNISGNIDDGIFRLNEVSVDTAYKGNSLTSGGWSLFLDYLKLEDEIEAHFSVDSKLGHGNSIQSC